MRRGFAVSAFALILTLPLWAQRGGGHSGGHAGFGGGHAGGFSSRARMSGGHSGSIVSHRSTHSPSFSRRGFSRGPIITNRNRGRFRGNRLRNNCYGFACRSYGYPLWGYGYYDPSWWWNNDSSYDDDYNQNLAIANEMNQQSLDEQRMMRQEEADGDQDVYARRQADSRSAAQEDPIGAPILPSTMLVFRDGHQQEVQNYAIVGETIWNFASHRTQKISLSSLDLPATEKANDDRGVTFRLPAPAAGQ